MIVRGTPGHLPYLRRLKEQVMADRYRPAANEADFASWRDVYCTDDYFQGIIDDPDAMLLTIGTLREPVGMAVLRRTPDHLEIDDLLVLRPRQGDGTRLIVACLRYAEVWRMPRVVVDVYPGHAGVEAFLQGHDFARGEDIANDLGRPMHRYVRRVDPA